MNSRFAGPRLIQLFGHRRDEVKAIGFSPDSAWVASGANDGRTKIWHAGTGTLAHTLEGHKDAVTSLAFSSDGWWLASGSNDCSVRLWNPSNGTLGRILKGHEGSVTSLAFSPDGRRLVSGSDDGSVRLWDPSNGTLAGTLEGPEDAVTSLAFSPDGRWLASGSNDDSVRLWDPSSGTLVGILEGHDDTVTSLAFSPDGRWLATSSDDGSVRLWDPSSGALVRTLRGHQNSVTSLTFSPDGWWLASGSKDCSARLWDPSNGTLVRILEGHDDTVTSLAFSPDGRWLASGSDDFSVRLWDPSSGKQVRILDGHEPTVTHLAVSPDGRWLASSSDKYGVRLWDPSNGTLVRTLEGHEFMATSLSFSPNGRWLASASSGTGVQLWDVTGGVGNANARTGHSSNVTLFGRDTLDIVTSLAFSPDGRWLASVSSRGRLQLWDLSGDLGGDNVRTWGPSSDAPLARNASEVVASLAFSPDGRWLASSTTGSRVRLWDPLSGTAVRSLKEHDGTVMSLAFSPDGRWLASGSSEGSVRLWDPTNGAVERTLEGHEGKVTSLAFSPNGWLASGSDDGCVRLWEVAGDNSFESRLLSEFKFAHRGLAFVSTSTGTEPFAERTIWLREIGEASSASNTIASLPGAEADGLPPRITSAKIVLLGESNSGKSSLALRLAEDRYEDSTTTHGMRLWEFSAERLDPSAAAPTGEHRKVVLWDLGGQDEYRLIHQLFIHDTQIALILLDVTRGSAAFDDAREWYLRLQKQSGLAVKLLIGSKLDTDDQVVDHKALDRLRDDCKAKDFICVSAKTGRGVASLRETLAAAIDWKSLGKTSRPALFQRVYDEIKEFRRHGVVAVAMSDLREKVRRALPNDFDSGAVDQVVDQLARQGALADTHRSSGERMLVLRLGDIERYAGSVIFAAKQNPRGVPLVDEHDLTKPDAVFPRIKAEERLLPSIERVVLECVVQLMVERGVCLRQAGLLIFPSLFPVGEEHEIAGAESVSLYYDFTGPIDNIYAGLVATAAISERFGRVRLTADRAEFDHPNHGICGLKRTARRSGRGHLDLLFSQESDLETRRLFTVFVEDYLRQEGVSVAEVLQLDCVSADFKFDEDTVRQRIKDDKDFIVCPRCDQITPINAGAPRIREVNPEVEKALTALKTNVKNRTAQRMSEVRRAVGKIKVFVSYAHADETLKVELFKHLFSLRREGVIDLGDDRYIEPDANRTDKVDLRLEEAQVILLLVSPDFLVSPMCFEIETTRALARRAAGEVVVIPVVLRPVAWQRGELGELQPLPRDGKAVTSWINRDEAMLDIAEGLRLAVNALLRTPAVGDAEPVPSSERASIIVKTTPPRPVRILHLSDLHFTASTDAAQMLQPLVQDIRGANDGLGFREIDYLVLSGDLTCAGHPEEFERVHRFLAQLFERFSLSAERCMLVPGNHDLSWEAAVYDWRAARSLNPSSLSGEVSVKQGDGYLVRDEKRYPTRFDNFARFHHQLTQLPYPPLPQDQTQVFLSVRDRIQFVGLNSAWQIDEYFRDRSSINGVALAQALEKADAQIAEAEKGQPSSRLPPILRLAVWHHPISGSEKMDDAFIDHLRKAGVKLCLHGHVHENRADVMRYLTPTKFYVVGAGSFGAVAKDRPESTPRLYNLIEIMPDRQFARVHTRCMSKASGAWEGWANWPGVDEHSKRTYYEIPLGGTSG